MTLTVEDGTGVVGAESYVSVDDATAYWAKRPQDANAAAWTSSTDPLREGALREASDYLDGTWGGSFPGIRLKATQGLLWPRVTVEDTPRYSRFNLSNYYCWGAWIADWPDAVPVAVVGFDGLALDLVPKQIVQATIELAVRALSGRLASDISSSGKVLERAAGGSSIKYAEGTVTADGNFGLVTRILGAILEGGGSWAWR